MWYNVVGGSTSAGPCQVVPLRNQPHDRSRIKRSLFEGRVGTWRGSIGGERREMEKERRKRKSERSWLGNFLAQPYLLPGGGRVHLPHTRGRKSEGEKVVSGCLLLCVAPGLCLQGR